MCFNYIFLIISSLVVHKGFCRCLGFLIFLCSKVFPGLTFQSRVSGRLLNQLNLNELIAINKKDYERKAVEFCKTILEYSETILGLLFTYVFYNKTEVDLID